MRKVTGKNRFSWSDISYDPQGTRTPAEAGLLVRRQADYASHNYLKQARRELMTSMLQRSQTKGWEERSWAAFHSLWNVGDEDGIGHGISLESDETFYVDTTTTAPDNKDSHLEDDIEVEFLSEEDIMDMDHFVENSERRTGEQTDSDEAAEGMPFAPEMTEDERRKEILALLRDMRQRLENRIFENEAERESVLSYLADLERQHGPS